jgi:hypothetical protein
MAQKVKFVSPFGTAQYPHISSADTVGKFADGKFKTKTVHPLGDAAAQSFIKAIDDAATTFHGKAGASLYKPYVIDEDANTVTFVYKTQYAPAVFDSRNKPILSSTRIGGGSVIRLLGNLVEYEKGLTAQFNQVQVKALNGPGVSAFDEVEDGYAHTSDEPAEPTAADPVEGASANAALDI